MGREAYQHLYDRRWRKRRAAFLASNPLCVMCAAEGLDVAAAVADHIVPHKGDRSLFVAGDLQALCFRCHDSIKQLEERGRAQAIGRDGWPIGSRTW